MAASKASAQWKFLKFSTPSHFLRTPRDSKQQILVESPTITYPACARAVYFHALKFKEHPGSVLCRVPVLNSSSPQNAESNRSGPSMEIYHHYPECQRWRNALLPSFPPAFWSY
ncbi:hypothetical protein J6590_043223 [Homalodisca vitripennis]|nr:hypothetical protein J6590_043223 [Homalodisca vitripennis]